MNAVNTSGKRKSAIARATLKKGTGRVRINKILLSCFQPETLRMKISEPLIIADKITNGLDIEVVVTGGGITSQAEAARLAIARALVEHAKDSSLEKAFLEYDRQMLVADVRRRESRKPNTNSKARAMKQKSYR